MIFTPAACASSAAAAAAVASCGQIMITLTPWEISASTLAFSLAESPWLKRIWTSYPAALKASLKRVSSWIHLGSSLVGRTTPTDSLTAGGCVAAGAWGAVVSTGAAVGVAAGAQLGRIIAAMNRIATKTYSGLFLNIITPPY